MKKCAICENEDQDDMNYCSACGQKYPEQSAPPTQPPTPPPAPITDDPTPPPPAPEPVISKGRIVFSNSSIDFDEHQKVVGRAELSNEIKNQGKDPLQVSRQHFTIYSTSGKYYIVDGVTSVQEKPSSNHTKVNGKDITEQGDIELHHQDQIEIATIITCTFEGPEHTGIHDSPNSNSSDSPPPPPTGGSDSPPPPPTDDDIRNKYDNMPEL